MTASQRAAEPVPSPTATAISIQFWGASGRESRPVESSWNTQNALVYMVADLVAANDGVPLKDVRTNMSARFESPAKALKAAKQIQGAILEFARHRPGCSFAAAIVIHSETESEMIEGRDSHDVIASGRSLLQHAKPAQILMTDGAYEKLREMPGLRFRPVTPVGTAGSNFMVRGQELIWRTPETPARSSEALPQATQIFGQNSELPSVKVLPMPESILAHPDDMEAPLPDLAAPELQVEQPINARPTVLKRSVAAVGGAIVLSLAIGLIVHYRKPVADHSTGVSQAPSAQPNVPTESNPPVVDAQPPENPPAPVPPEPSKPKPKAQAEKAVNTGYFSAKDIPFLLRKADSDAGAGRYDDARREYRIVLQLDPNNANAKQGLHRLELAR